MEGTTEPSPELLKTEGGGEKKEPGSHPTSCLAH